MHNSGKRKESPQKPQQKTKQKTARKKKLHSKLPWFFLCLIIRLVIDILEKQSNFLKSFLWAKKKSGYLLIPE